MTKIAHTSYKFVIMLVMSIFLYMSVSPTVDAGPCPNNSCSVGR